MTTNGESKFSYLLVGLGLGAIGGFMAAILGRRETREVLRERGGKSLDYLNQQPTTFVLPPEAVDRLRKAAGTIISESPEFKRLLRDVGAKVITTPAAAAVAP